MYCFAEYCEKKFNLTSFDKLKQVRGVGENIALAVLQLWQDRHAYLIVNCNVLIVFT